MAIERLSKILLIIVGILTILEFVFVKGFFTWIIMVALVVIVGLMNVILRIKDKKILDALLTLILCISLCMGYFSLA